MSPCSHVLYECASGFALFEYKGGLDIAVGGSSLESSADLSSFEKFGKCVSLVSFAPFTSAVDALEQINAVSESNLTDSLRAFLQLNMPSSGSGGKKESKKSSKKSDGGVTLGVGEAKLGSAISDTLGCSNERV